MNIREFLESGALELYALGQGTEAERAEIEQLLLQHPELRAELEAINVGLEAYALANAKTPPAQKREEVLKAMAAETGSKSSEQVTNKAEVKVINMHGGYRRNYSLAAAWALFVVSAGAALFFYGKWQSAEAGYQGLLAEKTQLAQNYEQMQAGYVEMQELTAAMASPKHHMIRLKGTEMAPEAMATVAWNPQSGEVKLVAGTMPSLNEEQQFQLWAIVDGNPVDAGVFDMNQEGMTMLDMKTMSNAQAFAVTIEPRGGSENPTLTAMVVVGSVEG